MPSNGVSIHFYRRVSNFSRFLNVSLTNLATFVVSFFRSKNQIYDLMDIG